MLLADYRIDERDFQILFKDDAEAVRSLFTVPRLWQPVIRALV
jgi:hypothetical protein